jgi:hypothetical protein
MITLQIDVLKINKDYLFKGEKGTYLDIVLIETTNNTFGNDYMVVQSVPKLIREKNPEIKGNILGNGKIVVKKETPVVAPKKEEQDDLPF